MQIKQSKKAKYLNPKPKNWPKFGFVFLKNHFMFVPLFIIRGMNRLILLTIFTAAFLSHCKCKKDDPQPNPTPAVPLQDITQYAYFKTGTYWILKDSATGVEDSVYVFRDTAYLYYQNNGIQAEGNYMFYTCQFHSYLTDYNYVHSISMGWYSTNINSVLVEREKNNPYVGRSALMSNVFDIRYPHYYWLSPGEIRYKEWFDSLNADGIVYHNVVHFQDTENASENFIVGSIGSINPTTDYFIAKNIGIVKIQINDYRFNQKHKTQNLIRAHIVQ